MIYLDTSFCIYLIEGDGLRGEQAMGLFMGSGEIFAASALVKMECLIRPFRDGNSALQDKFRAVLNEFVSVDLSDDVYERATQLRADTSVKTPDALHWAVALENGCTQLWTGDRAFARCAPGYVIDQFAGIS